MCTNLPSFFAFTVFFRVLFYDFTREFSTVARVVQLLLHFIDQNFINKNQLLDDLEFYWDGLTLEAAEMFSTNVLLMFVTSLSISLKQN